METELTPKQVKFVTEYLIDHNAAAAARRAGYSAKTANVQGAQLLSNAKIKGAVSARQKKDSEELSITKNMLLRELAGIAFADPAELIYRLQNGQSLEGMNLRFLKSLSLNKTGWSMATKDKLSAIALLMKYMGFEAKPGAESFNDSDTTETSLQAIQRIIAERARRETEEEAKKTSEAAAHRSSLSHLEKGPSPNDFENKIDL